MSAILSMAALSALSAVGQAASCQPPVYRVLAIYGGRHFGQGADCAPDCVTTISMLAYWTGRLNGLSGLAFFAECLILAIITLPWVVAVSYQTDGAFLDIAIRGDFISKVQSGQESHGAPFGTYFGLLGLLFFPGIAFAGFLFWQGREMLSHPASRFCFAWLAGYWLVIELVPTKLPHYVLPVLPALALLIANALVSPLPPASRIQRGFILAGYILAVIWGAVLAGVPLAGDKLWRTVRRMGFYLCDAC